MIRKTKQSQFKVMQNLTSVPGNFSSFQIIRLPLQNLLRKREGIYGVCDLYHADIVLQPDILRSKSVKTQGNLKGIIEPTSRPEVRMSAQDWIRTSTPFRALPPQSSVSTNFTTWAIRATKVISFSEFAQIIGYAGI